MSAGKQAQAIPETSGIYQIRCNRNGKIYVGSAVNFRARWDKHRRELRQGTHGNPHLQYAWELFGEVHEGFIDPTGQRMAPIRNLAAFCRNHGLDPTHMVAVAKGRILSHRGWTHVRGRTRLPAKVHKGFIAPGGAVVRITNLSAFCRACGLAVVHMFELKNGKRPSHKGWTWKHDADRAFE